MGGKKMTLFSCRVASDPQQQLAGSCGANTCCEGSLISSLVFLQSVPAVASDRLSNRKALPFGKRHFHFVIK